MGNVLSENPYIKQIGYQKINKYFLPALAVVTFVGIFSLFTTHGNTPTTMATV